MAGALLTDLYELNMAASYLRRGMDGPATFSLFVRRLPPTRGFLVAAGLEPCLEFLERFGFEDEDLRYLADELGYDDEVVEAFRELRFTGDVSAVPDRGRAARRDVPAQPDHVPDHHRLEGGAGSDGGPGPGAGGLRLPPDAGRRRRDGRRADHRHGGVRRDEQRRGGPTVRPHGLGDDGPLLRAVV